MNHKALDVDLRVSFTMPRNLNEEKRDIHTFRLFNLYTKQMNFVENEETI
jgi:hypothetical protein